MRDELTPDQEHISQYRKETFNDMTWRAVDGRNLHPDEMETMHVFNCMKMVFNHWAEYNGGRILGECKNKSDIYSRLSKTNPGYLLDLSQFFLEKLVLRTDFPDHLDWVVESISDQICDAKVAQNVRPKIEPVEIKKLVETSTFETPLRAQIYFED